MISNIKIVLLQSLLLMFFSGNLYAQDIRSIDSLKQIVGDNISDFDKVGIELQLAKKLKYYDNDEALKYAQEAYKDAIVSDFEELQYESTLIIAEIYWMQTKYRESLVFAFEYFNKTLKVGTNEEKATSTLLLSYVFFEMGNYEKSLKYSFNSLDYFQLDKNDIGLSKVYTNIGNIYSKKGDNNNSFLFAKKALANATNSNDSVIIAMCTTNLASAYGNLEEYDEAKKYTKIAIGYNEKIKVKEWLGANYMNLAVYQSKANALDSALVSFSKAESIISETNDYNLLSECYVLFSQYYFKINDIDNSIAYALKSFELSDKYDQLYNKLQSSKQLQTIYTSQNEYELALKYLQIQYDTNDLLEREGNESNLESIKLQYEYNKKADVEKVQNQWYSYILILIILVLILIVTLVFLQYRELKSKSIREKLKKQELASKLIDKEKELTSNTMLTLKKNNALSDISSKLSEISKKLTSEEEKSAINSIVKKISKSINDELWQEFDLRFRNVHNDFYERLSEKHPDLSPNEQRICAFLKLNLSSKDISELTGQRVRTLEIARSRMRSKLGIKNTDVNLISYIAQI